MPSAWPDWNKFRFLKSWYDPAEIRTTPYPLGHTFGQINATSELGTHKCPTQAKVDIFASTLE